MSCLVDKTGFELGCERSNKSRGENTAGLANSMSKVRRWEWTRQAEEPGAGRWAWGCRCAERRRGAGWEPWCGTDWRLWGKESCTVSCLLSWPGLTLTWQQIQWDELGKGLEPWCDWLKWALESDSCTVCWWLEGTGCLLHWPSQVNKEPLGQHGILGWERKDT